MAFKKEYPLLGTASSQRGIGIYRVDFIRLGGDASSLRGGKTGIAMRSRSGKVAVQILV